MFVQAGKGTGGARSAEYDPETALMRLSHRNGTRTVVIGQLGQSLDGRIATPAGVSKYINGREALRHLHRLRAEVDAVIIGVGTAIADDPQLTTRHVDGPNPVRVVIDPSGRMPPDLALLHDRAAPVICITDNEARAPAGAERLTLACEAGRLIPPARIVAALAARGLRRLLVEGGAETLARFLDAGAVDELHLMVAPIVLGDADFVLGSRVLGKRESGSMSWHQIAAGRVAGLGIRLLYGSDFTDMCTFRAIRRDVLLGLGMRELTYGWNIEMQMRAARAGLRILEIPVPYRVRRGGVSKVAGSLSGTLRAGLRIIATFLRVATQSAANLPSTNLPDVRM